MEGIKIYSFDTLNSTNNKAKSFNSAENEYVIYTKNQTNGRGQYDRRWISRSGLTFSIALKKENINYSTLVPVAIQKFFKEKGIEVTIKFPNDIYYQNKKLGGILVENIFNEEVYLKTIIGIGLNINEEQIIEKEVKNSICINLDEKDEIIINEIYKLIVKETENKKAT